jgi:hypothetical protein
MSHRTAAHRRAARTVVIGSLVVGIAVASAASASADHEPLDLNGNDLADYVISAPGASTWAYWISTTSPTSRSARAAAQAEATAAPTLYAPGFALAGCDVNGDGYDDIIAGDPYATELVGGTDVAGGAVFITYGAASGTVVGPVIGQQTSGIPGTAEDGDSFGFSVACGNLNGDAYADIVVGVPYEALGTKANAGAAIVIPGASAGPATSKATSISQDTAGIPGTAEADDEFGWALTVGDVTGDGRDDIIVGAPGENSTKGTVHSIKGAATSSGWTASGTTSIYGGDLAGGNRVGSTLVTGHLSGHAAEDLVIFGLGVQGSGWLYEVRGGSGNVVAAGAKTINQSTAGVPGSDEAGDYWGGTLAVGNVDANSYDDLLLGAPGEAVGSLAEAGGMCLLKGSSAGLTGSGAVCYSQDSTGVAGTAEADDQFGSACLLLDVTGDGRDDAIVGSQNEDIGSTQNAGMVHVFTSDGSRLIPGWTHTASSLGKSTESQAQFGWDLLG